MSPEISKDIKGTLITQEVTVSPNNPEDYEYPFPDHSNNQLFKRYKEKADSLKGVLICGRLGDYKYYDMDQAIGRAMQLVKKKIFIQN